MLSRQKQHWKCKGALIKRPTELTQADPKLQGQGRRYARGHWGQQCPILYRHLLAVCDLCSLGNNLGRLDQETHTQIYNWWTLRSLVVDDDIQRLHHQCRWSVREQACTRSLRIGIVSWTECLPYYGLQEGRDGQARGLSFCLYGSCWCFWRAIGVWDSSDGWVEWCSWLEMGVHYRGKVCEPALEAFATSSQLQ
jgi:hypothetical protein